MQKNKNVQKIIDCTLHFNYLLFVFFYLTSFNLIDDLSTASEATAYLDQEVFLFVFAISAISFNSIVKFTHWCVYLSLSLSVLLLLFSSTDEWEGDICIVMIIKIFSQPHLDYMGHVEKNMYGPS